MGIELELRDWISAFIFVLTFLLTYNRVIIVLVFILIITIYDVRGSDTPITTLPKLLLGRHEFTKGFSILISQILGMVSAIILYKFLVKYGIVMKHKLE